MEKIPLTLFLYLAIPILLLLWYIEFHVKRRRLYKLAEQFNGPPTIPFFGNALSCFVSMDDIANRIVNGMQGYESPTRLWFGKELALHIWDPKQLEVVLNSPYSLNKHPYAYKTLTSSVRNGLFGLPGQPWKRHRRIVAPILTKRNVEHYCDAFARHSKTLVKELRCMNGKEPFDIESALMKATFAAVLETLLQLDENECQVNIEHFLKCIEEVQAEAVIRCTNVWYLSDFIFNLVRGKKFRAAEARSNKYMDTIVEQWYKKYSEQRKKEYQEHASATESERPVKRAGYLLSHEPSNGVAALEYEEALDEAKTLLVGGFESTATMLGNTLLCLALYPDIQEKLYREIQKITDANGNWKYSDVERLGYLDRVVKESMRVLSPGAGVARIATQDIQLDDRVIPAGTSLLIGMLAAHNDPKVWPNPTKFDPDRFLPEAAAKRHPYSWIPFLAGVRNCVGLGYAVLFMKVAIVELVKAYRISTSYKDIRDIQLRWIVFFKPIDGFKIGLTNRL